MKIASFLKYLINKIQKDINEETDTILPEEYQKMLDSISPPTKTKRKEII